MQEVEPVVSRLIFQLVFNGLLFFIQLSVVLFVRPLKKSIERIEADNVKQWARIDGIADKMNKLIGAHDALHGGESKEP